MSLRGGCSFRRSNLLLIGIALGKSALAMTFINKKDKYMQSIIIIILIGLMGGVAVGIQAPLSSMISQRLGVMESVFIIHIGWRHRGVDSNFVLWRRKIKSMAHGPLVCALCGNIWPCGDLFHELHDSPHWSCHGTYHLIGRPASHRNHTGSFWIPGRSCKTIGFHARIWVELLCWWGCGCR